MHKRQKLHSKVEVALKRLSARNRTARRSGTIEDRYNFLWRVYRVSNAFKRHARSERIARMLGWKAGETMLDTTWFIGRVLRRTSKDDRHLRSKHAAALSYAVAHGVSPEDVSNFIQAKGGCNACAEPLRRRRRKGLC
jgi:hypothetical protein